MVIKRSVVVIGAGIVGAAIARELARAGHKVYVLEKDSAGGAVSGASLACISAHMIDLNEIPLLKWSCQAWRDIAEISAVDIEYTRCGQIRFIEHESELESAARHVESERQLGVSSKLLDSEEVLIVEPNLTGPILAATYDEDAATVNPFQAVRALLLEAKENGADVRTHSPAERIELQNDRVRGVVSAAEFIECDSVVFATGPWTQELLNPYGIELPILPRKAQCLATTAMPANTIRTVVSSCEVSSGVEVGYTQIQQAKSGQILFNTVLEGGLSNVGEQNQISEVDAVFVKNSVTTLIRLFPSLGNAQLLRSWVRFEAVAPDDRFLIGPLNVEGLFVAAADAGTGFIRAPAVGRLIHEFISEKENSFRTDLYDPQRFSLSV